jgi:hypothetical protein
MRIVISEVMDDDAVEWLRKRFDVLYEPAFVDERSKLMDDGERGRPDREK